MTINTIITTSIQQSTSEQYATLDNQSLLGQPDDNKNVITVCRRMQVPGHI